MRASQWFVLGLGFLLLGCFSRPATSYDNCDCPETSGLATKNDVYNLQANFNSIENEIINLKTNVSRERNVNTGHLVQIEENQAELLNLLCDTNGGNFSTQEVNGTGWLAHLYYCKIGSKSYTTYTLFNYISYISERDSAAYWAGADLLIPS